MNKFKNSLIKTFFFITVAIGFSQGCLANVPAAPASSAPGLLARVSQFFSPRRAGSAPLPRSVALAPSTPPAPVITAPAGRQRFSWLTRSLLGKGPSKQAAAVLAHATNLSGQIPSMLQDVQMLKSQLQSLQPALQRLPAITAKADQALTTSNKTISHLNQAVPIFGIAGFAVLLIGGLLLCKQLFASSPQRSVTPGLSPAMLRKLAAIAKAK